MQVVLSSFRVASASNVVDGVNDVGGRSRRFDDCTVLPGWSCERGLFEFVLCFKGNVGGFARRCDGIDGACCAEVGGGATSETGRGGGHCWQNVSGTAAACCSLCQDTLAFGFLSLFCLGKSIGRSKSKNPLTGLKLTPTVDRLSLYNATV